MLTVDFIEVKYHLFKSLTLNRIQFGEIEPELLPRKGDFVAIDSSLFRVEQLTFYPFGDSKGKKGVKIYIQKQ
jgi:hypothetical protein